MNKEKIAKAYLEREDDFDSIPEEKIHQFRKLINEMFSFYSSRSGTYFDFVDYEPYKYDNVKEMNEDFKKRIIKVNTTGNDSKLWGKVYNLMFRAVHDVIHCVYDLNFTFEDEAQAWKKQVSKTMFLFEDRYSTLDWGLFNAILRSEIVYQAAVKETTGEFHIDQKIILEDLTLEN